MSLKAVDRKLCLACNREFTDPGISHCPHDKTQLVNLGQDKEHTLVGETIDGKYVVQELTAKQGKGCLYKVAELTSDKVRSLRTVPAQLTKSADAAKLEERLRLWQRVIHPNVQRLIDFGTLDSATTYLVTEVFDAGTLTSCIANRLPFKLEWCMKIFDQAAAGLEAAHLLGLHHLELNPDSVIIQENGDTVSVKVTNFGLGSSDYSSNTIGLGNLLESKVFYLSPEEFQAGTPTAACDVYKLATILYEACTGRPPFQGNNQLQTASMVLTGKAFMPAMLGTSLATVLTKSLEKDPANRYQTMKALRAALAEVTLAR